MATVFKNLLSNDIATTRTLLNEAIPITGTIVSGTYNDENIKNYAHGMFQSVYDYPYLSSSANHIFDITYGYTSEYSASANLQNAKKLNIYNQMAQVLVGYDVTGSIRKFDRDGDFATTGSNSKLETCVFLNYSRLLTKDEVKKGSYRLTISGSGGDKVIGDYGAQNDYRVNSPTGEYGVLYTSSAAVAGTGVGLIYYQAGVAVLTASSDLFESATDFTGTLSISGTADVVREGWIDNDFNNTTELNSTVYFCRLNNNEFNYSSNPTYLSGSKIVTKEKSTDPSVAYVTSIGLYSADNELLAVAKLSEPLKKDQNNELTLRVRLDY
jgi:hypothetical protein